MPTKNLTSPFARDGVSQRNFKFGGGAEIVFTANGYFDDSTDPPTYVPYTIGYSIDTRGGNDTIYGSDLGDDLTGGDGSDTIFGGGGDDTIRGGNMDGSDSSKGQNPPPTNLLVGDGVRQVDGSYVASIIIAAGETVTAGWDTIFGGDGSTNKIYGDYVTVNLDPSATYTGGVDTLNGGNDGAVNDIFGDAEFLNLGADAAFTGGNDTITGGTDSENFIYGDIGADPISGLTTIAAGATFTGGNDTITGGAATGFLSADNEIYGDASGTVLLTANASIDPADFTLKGGMDTVVGGEGVDNEIYGDFNQVTLADNNRVIGGMDNVTGGATNGLTPNQNIIYGDARVVIFTTGEGQFFEGGDDMLTGGSGIRFNNIFGDAENVIVAAGGTFQGGVDTLEGGANGSGTFSYDNKLVGDANTISGSAGVINGGNDILKDGANADDWLYGDWVNDNTTYAAVVTGGADTFVFGVDNGDDTIKDFRTGDGDKIKLSDTAVTLAELDRDTPEIGAPVVDGLINNDDDFVTVTGVGINAIMVIDLGAAAGGPTGINLLTIEGVEELAVGDFIF